MREQLTRIDAGEAGLADLEAEVATARAVYETEAAALSKARAEAAARLDAAMAAELAPLKLDSARFRTQVETLDEAQWRPHGRDRVEFLIATNPGAPFAPLARIASGGELSRFILALKVALAEQGAAGTMIFDEIDRGVGGAVAGAIGERLARLAAPKDGSAAQVIVVTHSPQVAARGAGHLLIEKSSEGDDHPHRRPPARRARAPRRDRPHALGRRNHGRGPAPRPGGCWRAYEDETRKPDRRLAGMAALAGAPAFAAMSAAGAGYGLIGQMKARPGKRDELMAILGEGIDAMPGNIAYLIGADLKDPDSIWITEYWTDKAAHEASLKLPAVQESIRKGRPLIAGFGMSVELKPHEGWRASYSPPLWRRGWGWCFMNADRTVMLARAASMRRAPTEAERRLWMRLRASQLGGHKFRRQATIGGRIVDFFCPAKGLIVEIDGDTHDQVRDALRDSRVHADHGFGTRRFANHDVMDNLEGVLESLLATLDGLPDRWPEDTTPGPSSEEEGREIAR